MKHLEEYRDAEPRSKLAAAIARTVTRPWTMMEVCGGQTHSIVDTASTRSCRRRLSWFTAPAARSA